MSLNHPINHSPTYNVQYHLIQPVRRIIMLLPHNLSSSCNAPQRLFCCSRSDNHLCVCRYLQVPITSINQLTNQSSSLSSSFSFLLTFFCFFDNCSFHRPLTCALSTLGKMRSKISGEYHFAGTPSIPSLIFW